MGRDTFRVVKTKSFIQYMERSILMNKKSLVLLVVLACYESIAVARTLHALPLAKHPGKYSGWFDHDGNVSKTKRYDCATSIPYDGHKGTDFPVSFGTPIYSSAKGTIYKL
jgi:murein DD-endopeptidase MepM/ murein hydrolase activator NlpD